MYLGSPAAPDENSRYTVWVPVTFVMFAGTLRQEDQPLMAYCRSTVAAGMPPRFSGRA